MDDDKLMALVREGNHDAFAELVRRHTQQFFALAQRMLQNTGDAEDIVQNAFIKLWQRPSSWNAGKSQFSTWFYRVILNACHDHQRKHKRWVKADQPFLEAALQPVASEQVLLEQQQNDLQQQRYLEAAIADLPTSQRDALNLVVYSALPQKQAAEIMGISLKALESLLVRAKRSLAKNVAQAKMADALPKTAEQD